MGVRRDDGGGGDGDGGGDGNKLYFADTHTSCAAAKSCTIYIVQIGNSVSKTRKESEVSKRLEIHVCCPCNVVVDAGSLWFDFLDG